MRLNDRLLALTAGLCLMGSAAQDRAPAPVTGGPPPTDAPSATTSDRSPERYDQVGYATWYGPELAGNRTASGAPFDPAGFTAAHRSLPLGSYVEVTSLDTGKTVLVMINDRGPAQAGLLIDLSQAAARALGITSRGAVRVRRATPTPADRLALRNGQAASDRLDAPTALLTGLRAQLSAQSAVATPPPIALRLMQAPPPPRIALAPVKTPQVVRTAPAPAPAKTPPPPAAVGNYYVQIAAFGRKENAVALAKSLGGTASPYKSLWRVRTGPFADAKKAAQARDAAAARGYGDARVVRED